MKKRHPKKRGRKPWRPSTKDRQQVESATAMGLLPHEVAVLMGVNVKTLRKYCARELRTAAHRAVVNVGLAIYKQAMGVPPTPENPKGVAPNTTAGIFFLKARGGWRDQPGGGEELVKGKKEVRQEKAAEIAAKGRFAPSKPPRLAVVGGTDARQPQPAPDSDPDPDDKPKE